MSDFPNPQQMSPQGQTVPSIERETRHGLGDVEQYEPSDVSGRMGELIELVSNIARGSPTSSQESSFVRRHWIPRSHNVAPDPDGQTRLEGSVLVNSDDKDILSRGGTIGWEHVKAVMVCEDGATDEQKGRFRILHLIRAVFHAQPTRRFVMGILQWGHTMKVYRMDRGGGGIDNGFDVNEQPQNLLRVITGLAYSPEDALGCNIEIRHPGAVTSSRSHVRSPKSKSQQTVYERP